MSTGIQPPGPGQTPSAGITAQPSNLAATPPEITVVSHSTLFYWWPVWAVAFLMAILTWIDNSYMVTVPSGTKARVDANKPGEGEAWVLPDKKEIDRVNPKDKGSAPVDVRLHMSKNKNIGVIFCVTLILVILITNVPLRGMWSLVVIITVILLSVILALADWWEKIFHYLSFLDIRINMGGYLFLGLSLFAIWLITLLFFDRQMYVVFSPRQFKVRTEIGGGEKTMDAFGLKLEKQKSDLFRHYILGLGSGDLIVKTTGATQEHYDLPNVLFINKKVQQIENLLAMTPETRRP